MVKVFGFWELGWNTPIKEIDLWEYPLREFDVAEHIMAPVSGIQHKVTEVPTIDIALQDNTDLIPVYCHEDADAELTDFEHPENALYIFGKANMSPFNNMVSENSLSVKIMTPVNQGMLWPHQAVAIILYDRFIKDGNNSNR